MTQVWPKVPLKAIARVVGGSTPKSAVSEFWDGDIAWATPKDLSDLDGKYISDTPRKITEVGLRSCSSELLPANSVLLSSRAPIGHVAINRIPMATNQGFKSLVPNEKVAPSYLYWWLRSHRSELERLGNGATFKEISKAVVERVEILLPPLEEQKRIAAILDQADDIRRKRQHAIDRLNQLGQAIFYEMFGDPENNDRNWPVVKVGEYSDCIVPGRDKPKTFTGDIPWITTGEIIHLGTTQKDQAKAYLSQEEISAVRARVIPGSSVIMTCVGDLGKVSIAGSPMVINQQLHSYQCSNQLDPYFLMFMLSHRQGWMFKMATKTTLPYMNKSICNSVPIFMPPMELQKQFGTRWQSLTRSIEPMEAALSQIDALFISLQHRAFRGEL